MEWLHLNAGNDTNGNPRRLYLGIDDGRIVAACDEGYDNGYRTLHEARLRGIDTVGTTYAPMIRTTPAEYRALLKQFGK